MKFPNLSITINNTIITMIPIKAYKLSTPQIVPNDNNILVEVNINKIIVIYRLNYINTNSTTNITSIIPYYLSDGTTNNFRANMLYPFICINELDNINSGCMQPEKKQQTVAGLVYKYQSIQNLDLSFITNYIHQQIEKEYTNCINGIDGINFIKYVITSSANTGVHTVLSRLQNIIDFFIALSSEKFASGDINFNKLDDEKVDDGKVDDGKVDAEKVDAEKVDAGKVDDGKVDDGKVSYDDFKYYRPYMNKTEPDYNDKIFDYTIYSPNGYLEDIRFIKLYDRYRVLLLMIFRDYYKNFIIDSKIINVEYKDYDLEDITLKDFNNLDDIKICNEGEVIRSRIENTDAYINISIKLAAVIQNIPAQSQPNFLDNFKTYIRSKEPLKIEPLLNNIKGWNATCSKSDSKSELPRETPQKRPRTGGNYYNKYIKYKLKYLNLKE